MKRYEGKAYMCKIKKWKSGHCKDCNDGLIWSTGEALEKDYTVHCSNYHCKNHKKLEVYDTEVPEYYTK